MIKSRKELFYYLEQDRLAYGKRGGGYVIYFLIIIIYSLGRCDILSIGTTKDVGVHVRFVYSLK